VAREAARQTLLLVLLLVPRIGHTGREGDSRPVRRPDGLRGLLTPLRQAQRPATVERKDVELLLVAVAVGREGETRAVRRPARRAVGLLADGQLPRRRRRGERRR